MYAIGFNVNHAIITEIADMIIPYINTLFAFNLPEGIGLFEVLDIKLSIFLS